MALTKVSTDGVKDDAITSGKIPANAVGASELADNAVDSNAIADDAVTTNKIADNNVTFQQLGSNTVKTGNIEGGAITTDRLADDAVTAAKIADDAVNGSHLADAAINNTAQIADNVVSTNKLTHGTSSNDGKFLRANNGAAPSYETVTGTTINSNAANRVITGSNTANTLNGETNVHVTSNKLLVGTSNVNNGLPYTSSGGIQTLGAYNTSSINIVNNENSGNTSALTLNKVRGTSGGVSASDTMGGINWAAWDGTAWRSGITVEGKLTGSGANNVPSKLTFKINSGSSNTERFAITPSGVTFNGDTAAANALDDYEEGGWTPSMVNGGSSIGNDANNNRYVKIGGMVFITFELHSLVSPNGNTFEVGGLPYAISLDREGTGSCMSNYVTYGSNRTMISCYAFSGQSKIRFYTSGNATSWRAITGNDFSVSGSIIGTLAYFTV